MEKLQNELFEHITTTTHRVKYKKIDVEVILDTELTKNDFAIYLSILKCVNYDDSYTKITNKNITKITGIAQCKQGTSIDKLIEKGYIISRIGDNCIEYLVADSGDKYFKIPLNYFNGLYKNIKSYVRRLRYIALSNGNNRLPKLSIINTRTQISKEEYRVLRKLESQDDIAIYDSLQENDSKELNIDGKVIKLKPNLKVLDTLTIEEQLNKLLDTI